MVIAIDGPAGSGKSTIARKVAESLGFTYVNSGNLYRAITLRAIRRGVPIADADALLACAAAARVEYRGGRLVLDAEDVEDSLHSAEVDALVAQVSALPPLRDIVNEHVRRIAGGMDAVVEGRDMTTVVFPDAEAKFFLDASPEARARRRFDQGVSEASFEEIRKNIEMRDAIDRGKSVGSLKIAPDATYLDSSGLTIQEVYEKVYAKILLIREGHGR
jgi:cytidylate kinase